MDDDGLREDKDGNKLTINFASMSGGETAQPLADYYIQQWKEIGLDVQYTTGRLIEFNSFYDKLENDDPEIDVYQAAWNTGTDPNPSGLWGPNAAFNYTRYESEENTKLINDISSSKAFDEEYQKEAYQNGNNMHLKKHLRFQRCSVMKYCQSTTVSKTGIGLMMYQTHGQMFLLQQIHVHNH